MHRNIEYGIAQVIDYFRTHDTLHATYSDRGSFSGPWVGLNTKFYLEDLEEVAKRGLIVRRRASESCGLGPEKLVTVTYEINWKESLKLRGRTL